MNGTDPSQGAPRIDGIDETTQSSTMSFTGDFSAQLAALIAGGVSRDEMESISALPSGSAIRADDPVRRFGPAIRAGDPGR